MEINCPSNTTEYKLNSVPVRIRYTGPHSLQHFHTLEDEPGETVTYLRGRKLTGEKLPLGNALLLLKEFDDLKVVGKIKESTWFEREGAQQTVPKKIKEMQDLAELMHG